MRSRATTSFPVPAPRMIYRRPRDFAGVKTLLLALRSATVEGEQASLRDAVGVLEEMGWFDGALQPLYEANAVVKLVAHSLVPTIQELVLEANVLKDAQASVADEARAKRAAEYARLRGDLARACEASRSRKVSERFARMRDAMHEYVAHDGVQNALCAIFCALPTARLALRLMTERISESLQKDDDIVASDDIPMSALTLS